MRSFEKIINDNNSSKLIELNGLIEIKAGGGSMFSLGRSCNTSACDITRSDIVIDGSNAQIIVNIDDMLYSDYSIIRIMPEATNITIKNLNIKLVVNHSINSDKAIYAIYNYAEGVVLENVHIYMHSEAQINMFGIGCYGDKSDRWGTKGDNITIVNSTIKVDCLPSSFTHACRCYGVYIDKADNVSIQNCNIKSVIDGIGKDQVATGIYTCGKFGRFINNNIKASAKHPKAILREKAYAVGFHNDGEYSIISNNNIIGERGGYCIGLLNENKAKFANINGNKIHATHSVVGCGIKNLANDVIINSNILTCTCRNAKILDHEAGASIISNNYIRVLLGRAKEMTGCGIYAVGRRVRGNTIEGNVIRQALNCGIYSDPNCGVISKSNIVFDYENNFKITTIKEHPEFVRMFDEKNIKSIKED